MEIVPLSIILKIQASIREMHNHADFWFLDQMKYQMLSVCQQQNSGWPASSEYHVMGIWAVGRQVSNSKSFFPNLQFKSFEFSWIYLRGINLVQDIGTDEKPSGVFVGKNYIRLVSFLIRLRRVRHLKTSALDLLPCHPSLNPFSF